MAMSSNKCPFNSHEMPHDPNGPLAKQDYAVEIEGPLVGQIHAFCRASLEAPQPTRGLWLQRWRAMRDKDGGEGESGASTTHDGVRAAFVTRDNRGNRTDIERSYRAAVRSARTRVLIANAYFFPSRKFRLNLVHRHIYMNQAQKQKNHSTVVMLC